MERDSPTLPATRTEESRASTLFLYNTFVRGDVSCPKGGGHCLQEHQQEARRPFASGALQDRLKPWSHVVPAALRRPVHISCCSPCLINQSQNETSALRLGWRAGVAPVSLTGGAAASNQQSRVQTPGVADCRLVTGHTGQTLYRTRMEYLGWAAVGIAVIGIVSLIRLWFSDAGFDVLAVRVPNDGFRGKRVVVVGASTGSKHSVVSLIWSLRSYKCVLMLKWSNYGIRALDVLQLDTLLHFVWPKMGPNSQCAVVTCPSWRRWPASVRLQARQRQLHWSWTSWTSHRTKDSQRAQPKSLGGQLMYLSTMRGGHNAL